MAKVLIVLEYTEMLSSIALAIKKSAQMERAKSPLIFRESCLIPLLPPHPHRPGRQWELQHRLSGVQGFGVYGGGWPDLGKSGGSQGFRSGLEPSRAEDQDLGRGVNVRHTLKLMLGLQKHLMITTSGLEEVFNVQPKNEGTLQPT